ncbi:MAG: PQQ-like beta-propeller repeat protein [Candidatus Woesearchaeota archaeon]|nr:MAG: PQQ-like beta-propeller repeat protein [Candidatus Woesearchaeota archaeon]
MAKRKRGELVKVWEYDAKAPLLSAPTPAVLNDTRGVIIATADGHVQFVDKDGKLVWSFAAVAKVSAQESMFLEQEKVNAIIGPPIVVDVNADGSPEIIFGTEHGMLYTLDSDGKKLWEFAAKGPIRSSPLATDLTGDEGLEIVFGSSDKHLYILTNEGKLISRYAYDVGIESTPARIGRQIIFGDNDGVVHSLGPKGEDNWTFETGARIVTEPLIVRLLDDEFYVLVASTNGILFALHLSGDLLWKFETGGAIIGQPVVHDLDGDGKPEIVVGSCDNFVYAIRNNGDLYWSYETNFWIASSPIVKDLDGDGTPEVIAGSYDHHIYVLATEGNYNLDYVPGIAGVVNQASYYSEVMTDEPGTMVAKLIWKYKTEGMLVGGVFLPYNHNLVMASKNGIVTVLAHRE